MRLAVELGVLLLALEGVVHAQVRTIFHTRAVRQISADPFASPDGAEPDTEVEPDVAIDPNDPNVVVAVFQQGRFDTSGGCVDPGFATSQDGGATWTTGSLPGLTVAVGGPFDRASDPAVAIGTDGAVYAQTLPFDVRDCRSGLAVQRSDDHGVSFNAPVLVQDDSSCSVFNDKNWIAVDTFSGSPHHGRVYSAWDRIDAAGQPILTSHSDDGGQTWSAPVNVSGPFFPGGIGVIPLVQPTGDLTLLYTTVGTSASEEVAQMSHDGGATFGGPVAIATLEGTDPPGMRTGAGLAGAAVDPVTGHLYAVWQDRRFRADGLNDVVLSASADGGASWAPLRVVSESGPVGARDHFTPNVAAFGGTVLIVYGIRLHGGNRLRMRYVVSPDGGATFAREGGLGHGGNLDFAATANGVRFLGDYLGVTVSPTAAHAVWCLPSHPRGGSADPMHQVTFAATLQR